MPTAPEPDFDVAVVGAGPAGAVTAHLLAQRGHSVVLIERGQTPGSKNLSGGVLYGRVLEQVFPDYAQEAPVERRITRNVISFLTPEGGVAVDYRDSRLGDPVNAVTVLRAKFDPWLAERAEESGAFLMPGVRVDGLLTQPGSGGPRVTGIRAGDDELHTRVVVAADGANSFLARGLGIRHQPPTNQLAVGIKAVVDLAPEVIEERFGVQPGFGAAHALVGDCTQGVGGGGFLYTNTESLSVGLVLRLDDLLARHQDAVDVFDAFLAHPSVEPLLRGGTVVEYGSHLVNEGGLDMVGQIVADGMVVVGDAAGLTINSGLTVRGMDLAIGSAIVAADAIDQALTEGDTSEAGLDRYRERLFSSFVGKDMTTYARAPEFLERPRMYSQYGPMLEDILHGFFDLDTTPRRRIGAVAGRAVKGSGVRLRDLLSDGWMGVRSL